MAFLAPSVELVVNFCAYIFSFHFTSFSIFFLHFWKHFQGQELLRRQIFFAELSTGHGHEAARLCGRGPTFNLVQSPGDEWEDVMNCALLHCCTAHWGLWRFVKCIVATVQGKWCLVGGMQSCSRDGAFMIHEQL